MFDLQRAANLNLFYLPLCRLELMEGSIFTCTQEYNDYYKPNTYYEKSHQSSITAIIHNKSERKEEGGSSEIVVICMYLFLYDMQTWIK